MQQIKARPFGDLQPSGTRNRLTEVAWVRSPAIEKYFRPKEIKTWAVVVAQLAEESIAILEVHGLNPVIGKILKCTNLLLNVEKTKIEQKEAGKCQFPPRQISLLFLPSIGIRKIF